MHRLHFQFGLIGTLNDPEDGGSTFLSFRNVMSCRLVEIHQSFEGCAVYAFKGSLLLLGLLSDSEIGDSTLLQNIKFMLD
jgi:hypothetical protein